MDLWHWAGLAATTFIAALLYVVSGFGFAVLAAPLYLLFVDPTEAIQLVVIISTALSMLVVPGLRRAVAPGLLFRLVVGSLAGLPIGLVVFEQADPIFVRAGVGVVILAFATLIMMTRRRGARAWRRLSTSGGRDLVAGAVSGIATALVGMAGPPVLIYLLLAGTGAMTVRATLLAFFALSYGATLMLHAVTIGIPGPTWIAALLLIPVALLGGVAGRPIGDRLGPEAFAAVAIALLIAAGAYTITAAGVALTARSDWNIQNPGS
jgi:uncharacterized membrane protein YfcA